MRIAFASLLLAGCALQYGDDGTTPITGPTHRFVVDRIDLPKTNTDARQMGGDLNGDRTVDNQLGMVISTLNSQGDVTSHGSDMIAAGAIASSVEIVADDLQNDKTVAVTYHGQDGDASVAVTGELRDGWFRSVRTTSSAPLGRALVKLPVYVDADPATLAIEFLEIDLQPDGAGGYDGYLHGAVDVAVAKHEAFVGARQMISSNPSEHVKFMLLVDDRPHDWVLTEEEFNTNSLIVSFFSYDVTIRGKQLLSVGFRVHLRPCSDGDCSLSPPVDRCHDRVLDQDETEVDCGGATCRACQSPSCTNGIKDGFESEVDCGANCNGCAIGEHCYDDDDCPAGRTCGPPCSGSLCFPSLATCQ